MENYKSIMRDLVKENQEAIKELEEHQPFFEIIEKLAEEFSPNHECDYISKKRSSQIGYAQGIGTVQALYLDLRMAKDDTIALDIKHIVNQLKLNKLLKFTRKAEYVEMGWIGWKFEIPDTKARLLVRAWFENSTRCRKEGTGEFEEKMQVVCQ